MKNWKKHKTTECTAGYSVLMKKDIETTKYTKCAKTTNLPQMDTDKKMKSYDEHDESVCIPAGRQACASVVGVLSDLRG